MDLAELALNPRKASQRMSPLTDKLPEGQARKLEYFFGDRATSDSGELAVYSRDAATPPRTLKMLLKREAWGVVRPVVRGELLELIKLAKENGVPIVPRGAGTSGYGGSVPTEGGIVVDLRAFDKVLGIDADALTARVEANITFAKLDEALAAKGLTLRQYPTSYHAATLAGWYAQGGGGIGSLKYGPFRNDVIEIVVLTPDGRTLKIKGDELELFSDTHGTAGFILEMELKVRPQTELVHFLGSFDDHAAGTLAARRAALEAGAYNMTFFTPEYAAMVNKAAGAKILPPKHGVLATLEQTGRGAETLKGIMATAGKLHTDAEAQTAWDNRFNHLNLKRNGPSVVVGESAIHVEKIGDAVAAVKAAARMDASCVWAISISPTEVDIIFYGLDDERRGTYPLALGNALAVIDAVKALGGRSYSTGVLASNESKHVLGKDRLKRLAAWRKQTDKKSIFNPGPVLGARTRIMPLPVKDLPLQLSLASPLLKMQRGWFAYKGHDKADPQWSAQQRALGRVHAGGLGSLATEVTTCIFCGMCNAFAPEAADHPWETGTPRGRVELAKAVIEGRATLSARTHATVARTSLQHGPDAVCPTAIPIQRVTDLLLAACVDQLGVLPSQKALVANFAAHGNEFGKPADERNKWLNVGLSPVGETAFLPDSLGAYEAKDVVQAAALTLTNAGYSATHLAKGDADSAATLFEIGARAAADAHLTPLLTELGKRGIKTIVTPDANAMRAIAVDWPLVAADNELNAPDGLHTSTVLAGLIKGKKIEFASGVGKKAVVHVPEGLSPEQRADVMAVAEALGAELIDLPHHECGHGRALHLHDADLSQRMAEDLLRSATEAGAEVVFTMSPGCNLKLKTVAKKAKAPVEVIDLHVALAQHMKAPEGGAAPMPMVEEETGPVEPEIGPGQFRVEFAKEGVILAVDENQSILDAGEAAGMELPSSCKAGNCDTCSAKWEGTAPDQAAGEALSADQQKTYVLTCIARPKGPVKIWTDERP